MKYNFVIVGVIVVLLLSACNSTHKASVTPAQFQSNFKTVLIRDMWVEDGVAHKKDAIEHFNSQIKTLFSDRGFKVLPASLYTDTLKSVATQRGGYINTVTGKRDQAKYTAVRAETLKILREQHKLDSILTPELQYRKASFGNYRAKWDGQEEPYELNNSDMTNFLSTLVHNTGGTVSALSLLVFLEDNNGNRIYMGAGGIQLLAKLDDDNEFIDIPDEQLMSDMTQVNFAINESLRKLLDIESK